MGLPYTLVSQYLQAPPKENKRLWLEKLPAYSPPLNPAEQVWLDLAEKCTAQKCCSQNP